MSWLDWLLGKTPEEKATTAIKLGAGQAAPLPGGVPTAVSVELIKGTANAFGEATKAVEGVSQAISSGKDPIITSKPVDEVLIKGVVDSGPAAAKSVGKSAGKSLLWKLLDLLFGAS